MPDGVTPPADMLFVSAAASGADWNEVTKAVLDRLGSVEGCTLGFVYVSDKLAGDVGGIVTMLRAITGIRDWVGTVGIGVLGGDEEFFDVPAVAVLATRLSPDSYRQFPVLKNDLTSLTRAAGAWLDLNGGPVAFVHGDPRCERMPSLIAQLSDAVGAFVVGGLTSARESSFPQVTIPASTAVMPSGPVDDDGISGVLFGQSAGVQIGISQGCSPIGPVHTITEAQENVLIELDGRPALEVFKEDIGELLSRDLRKVAGYIQAALPIAGTDTGDYLVRELVGIDPNHGWVAIAEPVREGQQVLFTRRDRQAAEEDLRRMLRSLKKRSGPCPKGALYVSCLGRGRNTFGEDGNEIAIIRQELGDLPIAGFFASGEISHGRLYGYTGVLTLFT